MDDLIAFGSLTPKAAQFLASCVKGKLNVLISGGTGTGKTTMLNAVSAFVPYDERIVTIEDAAELQLQQEHVITLESRPPNIEGKGEVRIRELVRNALRMRPDRIIVGEVRGPETLDMLQAMNTGHEGSLTTIHANPARRASRVETLVMTAGVELPTGRSANRSRARSTCSCRSRASSTARAEGHAHLGSAGNGVRRDHPPGHLHRPASRRRGGGGGPPTRLLRPLGCTGLKPHFLEKMAANGCPAPELLRRRTTPPTRTSRQLPTELADEAPPPSSPSWRSPSRRPRPRRSLKVGALDASDYPTIRSPS